VHDVSAFAAVTPAKGEFASNVLHHVSAAELKAEEMVIDVVNPRVRNQRIFREITASISELGLKKPITVSRRKHEDGYRFDLVCGQGRLEAFLSLGQREIPALVVDANNDDCLVMSLVENVARRQHRAIDLLQDIEGLKRRGYSRLGKMVHWPILYSVAGSSPVSVHCESSKWNSDARKLVTHGFQSKRIFDCRRGMMGFFASVEDAPSKAIFVDNNSFMPPARAKIVESYSTICKQVTKESPYPLVKLDQ